MTSLYKEDDKDVYTWYAIGYLKYLRKDSDFRYYLCLAKQFLIVNPTDNEAMMQHIEEMLAKVGHEEPAPPVDDVLENKTEEETVISTEEETVLPIVEEKVIQEQATTVSVLQQ